MGEALTREERLRLLRERNAQVRSPSVTWLLAEVDRLDHELFERVTALRLALRQVHDLADATEPSSVAAGRIASEALEADGAAAGGPTRWRVGDDTLDLPYLATCVLEELEELGHLTGVQDNEDGSTSDEWTLAQAAAVLALQKGLDHLAQEGGEP